MAGVTELMFALDVNVNAPESLQYRLKKFG